LLTLILLNFSIPLHVHPIHTALALALIKGYLKYEYVISYQSREGIFFSQKRLYLLYLPLAINV